MASYQLMCIAAVLESVSALLMKFVGFLGPYTEFPLASAFSSLCSSLIASILILSRLGYYFLC